MTPCTWVSLYMSAYYISITFATCKHALAPFLEQGSPFPSHLRTFSWRFFIIYASPDASSESQQLVTSDANYHFRHHLFPQINCKRGQGSIGSWYYNTCQSAFLVFQKTLLMIFLKATPWIKDQIHWSKIDDIGGTLKFSSGNHTGSKESYSLSLHFLAYVIRNQRQPRALSLPSPDSICGLGERVYFRFFSIFPFLEKEIKMYFSEECGDTLKFWRSV